MNRRKLLQWAAGTALVATQEATARAQVKKVSNGKSGDFIQVDVFTLHPFEGNPLCVFTDAAALTDDQMQAIARELNHSETTFIQPSKGKGDAVVRIFGPNGEFPFAGHPTLGTAFVMAQTRPGKSPLMLEEKVGPIPVTAVKKDDGTYFEMTQNDPKFGTKHPDPPALAKALGFPAEDLDTRYTPQIVSTGSPFLIIPLKSSGALERLQNARLPKEERDRLGPGGTYYVVTGADEIESRLLGGGSEDPATGSAAGCATAFIVRYGIRKPDTQFVIHQGRFVKRPSFIYCTAALNGEQVHNVRVGGYVVEVLRGRVDL